MGQQPSPRQFVEDCPSIVPIVTASADIRDRVYDVVVALGGTPLVLSSTDDLLDVRAAVGPAVLDLRSNRGLNAFLNFLQEELQRHGHRGRRYVVRVEKGTGIVKVLQHRRLALLVQIVEGSGAMQLELARGLGRQFCRNVWDVVTDASLLDPTLRAALAHLWAQAFEAPGVQLDSIRDLAERVNCSYSYLSRKQRSTGVSLRDHLDLVKVQRAYALRSGGWSWTRVALALGYRGVSSVSDLFDRCTGARLRQADTRTLCQQLEHLYHAVETSLSDHLPD